MLWAGTGLSISVSVSGGREVMGLDDDDDIMAFRVLWVLYYWCERVDIR